MKERISHNLKLKIIAVLFAVGLWMISININDPYQSKDYSVVVQLQNMNVMTSTGKFVEVVGDTDEINVQVRGSRSVMDSFTSSNIVATADLKEMNDNFQVPIRLSTVKTIGNKIESMRASEDYLTVRVEDILRVQKNIEIETRNQPQEGYVLGNTHAEQNALKISGPQSIVKEIDRALVTFDLSGAKDDVSMLLPIELYNKDGERIFDNRLTTSISEVQCTASILSTKEVPVSFIAKGMEAKGYGFTGEIIQEPRTVRLAGKSSALRNIKEIRIEDVLDLSGARENVAATADIREYLPENVILADPSFTGEVNAIASVERKASVEFFYRTEDIAIDNIPAAVTAEVALEEKEIYLSLEGFASGMKNLSSEKIQVKVDLAIYQEDHNLSSLEEGLIEASAIVEIPDGIWLKEEVVIPVEIINKE